MPEGFAHLPRGSDVVGSIPNGQQRLSKSVPKLRGRRGAKEGTRRRSECLLRENTAVGIYIDVSRVESRYTVEP